MSHVIRSHQSLAQILDRLVEEGSGETPASFAALAKAAGLDPAHDFIGASLREIDLRNEDLRGFDFSKADLVGADLRGANLEGVSFSGADTTGCLGLPRDVRPVAKKNLAHVFIAYVRENRDVVDRLANELRDKGVIIWLDHNNIEPGARWRESIKKAIQGGSFFMACFSKEYNE
jgi:uncharacterized protein YjbI with pentapeptide repeats